MNTTSETAFSVENTTADVSLLTGNQNDAQFDEPVMAAIDGIASQLPFKVTRSVLYMAIGVLILFGNGLTIAAVLRFPKLRTVTNNLVVSLSLADLLLVPSSVITFGYVDFNTSSMRVARVAPYTIIPGVISQMMSLFSLLLIAADRYVAVVHATSYKTMVTHKRVRIAAGFFWSYSTILVTFACWYFGSDPAVAETIMRTGDAFSAIPPRLSRAILIPHALVSLIVIVFLYWRIIRRLKQQEAGNLGMGNRSTQKTRKITMLMVLVVAVLIITWLPGMATAGLINNQDPKVPPYIVYFRGAAMFLMRANSFMNPLLYAWKSSTFRKAYVQMLGLRSKVFVGQ